MLRIADERHCRSICRKAMAEPAAGKSKRVRSVKALMADLNARD